MKLGLILSAAAVIVLGGLYQLQNSSTQSDKEIVSDVPQDIPTELAETIEIETEDSLENTSTEEEVKPIAIAQELEVIQEKKPVVEEKKVEEVKPTVIAVKPVKKKLPKKKITIAKKKASKKPAPQVVTANVESAVKGEKEAKLQDEVSTKQAAIDTSLTKLERDEAKAYAKKFSGRIGFVASTNLETTDSADKATNGSVSLAASYRLLEGYSTSASISFNKGLDERSGYEDTAGDLRLNLRKKAFKILNKKVRVSPALTTIVPVSETSRERDELQIGLEAKSSFSYNINNNLSFSYTPGYRRLFHKYETNSLTNSRGVNAKHYILQYSSLTYQFSDKLYLNASLSYFKKWSYQGMPFNDSYYTGLEAGYYMNPTTSVAFGTSTGGSIYSPEKGEEQTIEILDDRKTSLYGSVSVTF